MQDQGGLVRDGNRAASFGAALNRGVSRPPRRRPAALDVVDGWLAQPGSTVLQPTARHAGILRGLLAPLGTAGNLATDAHLAALAVEHGAVLYSCDADFSRFPGLRWVDPLR
jgi:predicted nucleic acid-binding protein